MVKAMSKEETTTSSNGTKKQRKKQAKQEAKTMLKLEQAKKNERRAAKKVTKSQETFETYGEQIYKYEAMLSKIRSPHHEPAAEVTEAKSAPAAEEHEPDTAENLSSTAEEESSRSDNHANISSPTNLYEAAEPEAEVHEDVTHEQATAKPVVEDHTNTISQQETAPSADDHTYIPSVSHQETSFVEEGQ